MRELEREGDRDRDIKRGGEREGEKDIIREGHRERVREIEREGERERGRWRGGRATDGDLERQRDR